MNIIKTLIFKIKHIYRKAKLKKIKIAYPNVMSTTETLNKIIEGSSIARFGDGELQIIVGKSLGKRGEANEYQVFDKKLSDKLRKIIKTPTKNCIIAINKYSDEWDDEKNYKYGLSYFENFWFRHWKNLKEIFLYDYTYGCAATSRISVFKENHLENIKKIWENRKVLFVVGENSHFILEPHLFNNILEADMLVTKGKSSFDQYDNIIEQIKLYRNDWLIFISLGPTATVLAYELSKKGYQALDMGHLPNCYLQSINKRKSPEAEHINNKFFDKKIGLYKNICKNFVNH